MPEQTVSYIFIFLLGLFLGVTLSSIYEAKRKDLSDERDRQKKAEAELEIRRALIKRALRRKAAIQKLRKKRDDNTHDKQS